jgi:hypothetical protein
VWVTPLGRLEEATVTDNHGNEGQYTGSTVNLRLSDGMAGVETRTGSKAMELAAFLNALPDRRNLPALERGYQARAIAERAVRNYGNEVLGRLRELLEEQGAGGDVLDALPAGGEVLEAEPAEADVRDRAVTAIPEPHKARTSLGWWRYGVLLAVGVLLFLGSWKVSSIRRDDAFFNAARGKRPPELRAYLIDGRNTRHREEAQKLLDRFHDEAADRVAKGPGNAELRTALGNIVRSLKKTTHPVITIAFKPAAGSDAAGFPAEQVKLRQKAAARALAEHLGKVIGDDMAAYGEPPDGKAMFEIVYKLTVPAAGERAYRMEWTVTLREDPEKAAGAVYKAEIRRDAQGNRDAVLQGLYDDFVNNIKGQLPTGAVGPARPGLPGFPGAPRIRP